MKAYTQFRRNGRDILGSNGIHILDGRNNIESMICDVEEHIKRMRGIITLKHFQIRKGNLDKSEVIYERGIITSLIGELEGNDTELDGMHGSHRHI